MYLLKSLSDSRFVIEVPCSPHKIGTRNALAVAVQLTYLPGGVKAKGPVDLFPWGIGLCYNFKRLQSIVPKWSPIRLSNITFSYADPSFRV
jgi:hypothetical protein